MKSIHLSSRLNKDWSGIFVTEDHYDQLLDEDCTVYKPDGSPLLVLRKKAIPREIVSQAWGVLKNYNVTTNNRGVAAGTGYIKQIKEDGTVSNTNRTPPEGVVHSGIVGYFERTVRFPFCRACAWNLQNPELWAQLLPFLRFSSEEFERNVPGLFAAQKAIVDRSSKDFVIPGTVFTTVTINKNFRTACHLDAGDLPEGFSAMALIREGRYEGGNLVLPDFRVAVKLDTADLIFFDPHEYHGNTKILPLTKAHTRCTLVMYFREGIQFCGTAEEEFELVKNRKLGDPLK